MIVGLAVILSACTPGTSVDTTATRFPADLRSAIQTALVAVHLDPAARPALEAGRIDRLTSVSVDDYDDIRRMLAACEAAGIVEVR